jgi:hypothetical protein
MIGSSGKSGKPACLAGFSAKGNQRMLWIDEDQMNSAVSSSTICSPSREECFVGFFVPLAADGLLFMRWSARRTNTKKRNPNHPGHPKHPLLTTLAETSASADTRHSWMSFFPEFAGRTK